jgi:hypothetical protein
MKTPFGELPEGLASQLSMAEQFEYLRRRGISRRRLLVAGVLGLGGGAAAGGLWPSSPANVARIGPRHVAFGADAARQATVSFSTEGSFKRAVVDYGLDESFGARVQVNALTVPGVSTVYQHGVINGLAPGQRYLYRVVADGISSPTSHFTTAPATAAPFTFTAFGDEKVSPAAVRILGQIGKIRPAFHLLAGDICYADASGSGKKNDTFDPTVWDRWLSMIEPIAAVTPWMCATGNHDMEPGYGIHGYSGYLNRFTTPANGAPGCPTTYTFRYSNVAVIALDANDVSYEIQHNLDYSANAQQTWLARLLGELRMPGSGVDFIVVFFHHCAYSTSATHGSDQGIRTNWVPLFDRFDVDLVINGHAHQYERTFPIRNGQVTVQGPPEAPVDSKASGPTYITAGGGGAPATDGFSPLTASVVNLKDNTRIHEQAPWSAIRSDTHAFLSVTVTPASADGKTTMKVLAITDKGALLDSVTLTRDASAA